VIIPPHFPFDEIGLKSRAQKRIARYTSDLLALSALPRETNNEAILSLETRITRDKQVILDLESRGEKKAAIRANTDISRTVNPPKISQHATFGHLHIQVTPPIEGTFIWKWAIRKVKGGILHKEGFAESRDGAMQDAERDSPLN